ncbi:MAG: putative DNA binding domain-containing protein [Paludibacteraceae bacterium]|nr:putative DNA binding domain-containing protein [Paludibacteraceae bacterium]HHT61068.1 transcriptional regulator [Bacteroidales bacterium]MBP9038953.1 putative DNA binding domain-containing protein [Paludibacteraceae bacterium]HOA46819.1 ATP-binding protein [Paludibacteraceae bacterium]HOO23692.1 ATP-binding protein [Paludibacteraceae bacterium]
MPEQQNIEYKSAWHDDYLKWVCGFANAQGGTIFIGKDDDGKIVGVPDAKKLLEDIPNKVRDILGILVDVNLHKTDQGDYLEIVVEPYPNAISYKGQYHYRSGSTKQELKGVALDKFLLQKRGKHWDGVLIPHVSVSDLKQETFEFFKKQGAKSKRLDEISLNDTNEQLLENLKLKDGKYLKRAAILLFYTKPEKFVTGAYIKIGFFENDADLIFQDEVHGNLFEQIEKTLDLLFTKYIKAIISYENGINRVETYEYPKDAIREALLNAIAHKDYSGGVPIQISVYKDKIMIWNEGTLPEDWTIETLLDKHSSKPYNPDIANALFRSGYIESWGRGITKMISLCKEAGLPEPNFYYKTSGIWAVFQKDIFNEDHLQTLGLNNRQVKAVLYAKEKGKITNSEYQKINDCSRNTASNDLAELVVKEILKPSGQKGAGAFYTIK